MPALCRPACPPEPEVRKTMKNSLIILILLALGLPAHAEQAVTLIRVLKAEHKLQLLSGKNRLYEFHAVFGDNPVGHKRQEGDERTPEGRYQIDARNPNSAYYKSLRISYPNARDRAAAQARGVRPGGLIMIHGQKNGYGHLAGITQRTNWTDGCIALRDEEMEIVWQQVSVGTPIEILP